MAPGAFTSRPLPLPLKWQRTDENGHDTSVIVGMVDTMNIDEANEQVWGEGELFDDISPSTNPRLAEDVAEAKLLLSKGVIGPSVDPGSAQAVTVLQGQNVELGEAEFERRFMESGGQIPQTELLFTSYEIAAATLVPVPAFAECRPFELLSQGALTAAEVRSSGWTALPFAPREHGWDGDAAVQRIAQDCGIGGDSPDWDCYASAFLYRYVDENPETQGAYGFGIVDIVDGQRTIVPRAVFAVANILQGGYGGTTIPAQAQSRMKTIVGSLYKRMAKQFDDPSITAPWDAGKAALLATAGLPVLDPALFSNPNLERLTPITERDLGNGWVHVFGHVATHDVCHVGIPDECTTAPYSEHDYTPFHRYVQTGDGIPLPVAAGRITAAHGGLFNTCGCCPGNDDHACEMLSIGGAIAHHDRMRVLAYVCAGEDEAHDAIWVSGVRAPEADERDRVLLRRQKVSGDWRDTGGDMELVEVLALARQKPGFPLPRVSMAGGRQRALTAAGAVRPDNEMPVSQTPGGLNYSKLGTEIAKALVELVPDSTPRGVSDSGSSGTVEGVAPKQAVKLTRRDRRILSGPIRLSAERSAQPSHQFEILANMGGRGDLELTPGQAEIFLRLQREMSGSPNADSAVIAALGRVTSQLKSTPPEEAAHADPAVAEPDIPVDAELSVGAGTEASADVICGKCGKLNACADCDECKLAAQTTDLASRIELVVGQARALQAAQLASRITEIAQR